MREVRLRCVRQQTQGMERFSPHEQALLVHVLVLITAMYGVGQASDLL